MVAELSDLPLIMRARKYRDMAVKARSEAEAATWFVPRWSHMRQAQHWEKLAAESLRELRMEIVRANSDGRMANIDGKSRLGRRMAKLATRDGPLARPTDVARAAESERAAARTLAPTLCDGRGTSDPGAPADVIRNASR
jgi:hypothetical protein